MTRVSQSGSALRFEDTCIPTRSGALMRISMPTAIIMHAAERFEYHGRSYSLQADQILRALRTRLP